MNVDDVLAAMKPGHMQVLPEKDHRIDGWYDLGDGTAGFCFPASGPDGQSGAFRLDLVDWQMWHARWKAPEGADGFAFLEAVQARVKALTGIAINPGQADQLLHDISLELERVRLFREAERSSLLSTASTS